MAKRKTPQPATVREVRIWGRENGYEVGVRGRVSKALVDAFREATGRSVGAPEAPEQR